jgi:hypothetical protein
MHLVGGSRRVGKGCEPEQLHCDRILAYAAHAAAGRLVTVTFALAPERALRECGEARATPEPNPQLSLQL